MSERSSWIVQNLVFSVTIGSQDSQPMAFIHLMVLTYLFVAEKTAKCVQVTPRHAIYLWLLTDESKSSSYLKSISLSLSGECVVLSVLANQQLQLYYDDYTNLSKEK